MIRGKSSKSRVHGRWPGFARRGRSRLRFRSATTGISGRSVCPPGSTILAVCRDGHLRRDRDLTANLSPAAPRRRRIRRPPLGATDLGPVITDVNGVATIPAASLAVINVGTYTGDVTATFAGDANFASNGAKT